MSGRTCEVRPHKWGWAPVGDPSINSRVSSIAPLRRPTEPDPAHFLLADDDLRAVFSFDGGLTWLDERWEEAGFDRAAMLGRPWGDFLHPDDAAATRLEAARLTDGSVVEELDFRNRYRCADGSYRHLTWRTRPDPATRSFYCVARDVTDLLAMAAEREALAALVDSTGDAVARRTVDGTILWANRGFRELYASAVVGEVGDGMAFVPPEQREHERERLAAAFAGEVQRYEADRVRADGGCLRVAVTLSPVRDAAGAVTSVSSISRDVTARHEAEGERARALLDLERSNADLTQFAYVASHDLSAPLRSIGGFLSLLEHRYDDVLDERGLDYIRRVVAASARMRALIDDLLGYSRSSREELVPSEVDLTALAEDVAASHRAAVEAAGGRIEVGELPRVRADATGLRQVLENLIGNGVKFAREGEAPHVRVEGEPRPDGSWELRVDDAGIGIEPRHRTRAFEIFKRLNAPADYEGTGIGLSICKTVVERHGGRIWIEGSPLGGTRFVIAMPAAVTA